MQISKDKQWGILAGVVYGLVMRLGMDGLLDHKSSVMTVGFLFLVPMVLGVISVRYAPKPTWYFAIFGPWLSIILFVLCTGFMGIEGLICMVMALPIFCAMGSLGGAIAKVLGGRVRNLGVFAGFLILPLISSGIESQFALPATIRTVPTQIVINAPADVVWRHIIKIPAIQPSEHHFSFFHAIGFPKPVEATLSHEGVGGVRQASFERGLVFTETITQWETDKRIVFSIKANSDSIPPSTLDQHVTIGGEYFDMLEGAYDIETVSADQVVLHLSSKQRLSTRFNSYTALWTEAIMRSIQDYILVIIKRRCEAGAV